VGGAPGSAGAAWDAVVNSFVDTVMGGLAVRSFDEALAWITGPSLVSDLPDAQRSSFEAIYDAHYRDVARHVILTTRGQDDVEEIVAETFARAFAAWRSGRGPAGRPLPWLLVMARHIATDRWRRRRLIAWLPLPDSIRPPGGWEGRRRTITEPGGPDLATGVAEFWLWLDALSRALPTRQRDVILLRYQRDLTDEDIGEVLGLSASGVRTLASRALNGLRKHPELWS
jgi:RNA polymerase sigma factor (sigma-70 family)